MVSRGIFKRAGCTAVSGANHSPAKQAAISVSGADDEGAAASFKSSGGDQKVGAAAGK